ncbi:hypothetical protein K474DRAFT_1693732 [Panus rudis PR-1116 ss-1]|nr:hypothetical protein K474DRAFT_1693732 [Panus rudis PR-1116 ss-1]
MKLKEIHRTSTFAWSPLPSLPLLATGTVAGTFDESFNNNGQLEVWAPDFLDKNEYDLGGEGQAGPKASVTTSSRFNRLAWGYPEGGRDRGVLVAGMENGELDIWDPSKILANADQTESLILRNKTHTGPVRGLDFNPIQTNLFASGAVNGEIYIWDLKDPSKPYSPGTRSTKLDEITALAWNHHVQYALAAASSTGYTVVWDLRGKREVAALAYGGGAGTLAGAAPGFGAASMAVGGRRGMSDVAWHPDNATRLVTSSEDDTSPIIMVWDLRNARAPEKILTGHEKGVLSLSWCKQDADLLLSCGKDNRALCWNPQTSEIIGELPSADNWAFQVDWCPRNPDLFATAFFDGTIGIHSIQSTNEPQEAPVVSEADALDVFNAPGFSRASQATLSLSQPPKWLRRPTSSSFGYGGKLVSVSNLPSAQGKHQSGIVHIRKVTTEPTIIERAKELQEAIANDKLNDLAEDRTKAATDEKTPPAESSASWKALLSLFHANSRDELITLLGFSKEEVASKVAEAVAKLKASQETPHPPQEQISESTPEEEQDLTEVEPREPVVSFAEPERSPTPEEDADGQGNAAETTPSEVSTGAASDTTTATRLADGESTTTAPSLFGDEPLGGTPQTDAAADFFGSIGTARNEDDERDSIQVPHTNYPLDSSVAATIGSRPSSVTSESLKVNTFRIYPADESETDRLVTKALVLGDFESAVSLCLSSSRFADAILLAVRGGQDLLNRTQKAYFEKLTTEHPYLRLFQSIVTNDLDDIVQNADLQEWQEIFVVLCTFASQEEFSGLAEQLGQRLEFQASLAKASSDESAEDRARELRKNATLTYLAAGKLERLVNIWIEELAEEEKIILSAASSGSNGQGLDGSRYTAHALALQTFIEKVTIFRRAINYEDTDLKTQVDANGEEIPVKTYKLSGLYDRYFEYADLLATQGLLKEAVEYLKLTPAGYTGSPGSHLDFKEGRERLLAAAGVSSSRPSGSGYVPARGASLAQAQAKALPAVSTTSAYAYPSYAPAPQQQQQQPAPISQPPGYGAPAASSNNPYAPPPVPSSYAPPVPAGGPAGPYANHYAQPPQPAPATGPYGVPPPVRGPTPGGAPPPVGPPPRNAAPPKRDNGGWNDAPANIANRRTPNITASGKPAAITAPFPNAVGSPGPSPATPPIGSAGFRGQQQQQLPPPPRPGSVQQRPPPPPGPGSQFVQQQPLPSRMMSPPQTQPLPPPPHRGPPGPPGGQQPPPPPQGGPYARLTPSPSFARGTPPPPHHQQPGPYVPPPQAQGSGGAYPPQGGPGSYVPNPQQGSFAPNAPPPSQQPGPYGPPPQAQQSPYAGSPNSGGPGVGPGPRGPGGPPPGPGAGGPPPPPGGPARAAAPPAKTGPPPPKYPPGDRSHIPDHLRPVYEVISGELNHFKQVAPPNQKRLVEDLERRINPLFDALNCETLSKYVQDQLVILAQAMAARDRNTAMAIHVELLTRGSITDDIGIWMAGVKQLIMRL